ncbi:MAG: MarR family transcriptional regulator [Cereibacter sphaeroides]|uniref:MarR family transcriptional regulator n=1 Tax=Cereibacter sphaeroides TaxID=1063 RepID=A0A2W5SEU6_CERSP|nr:MAG: MarR family transcriptional regulator [Cereibacter sphaeroides]
MHRISDLTAHTGYWLRMLSNAVSQDFAQKISDQGVSVAEWVLLRSLYDTEGMAPSALAARMGMTKGAITKLADKLLEKRLILRSENPDDRRAQNLTLTMAGRQIVPVLAELADQNDTEYFGHLSVEEQQSLDRILKALVARQGLHGPPVD